MPSALFQVWTQIAMDVSRSGTSTAVAAEPGRHCQSGASIVTVKVGTIMIAAGPAAVPHGARRRRGDCRRCFAACLARAAWLRVAAHALRCVRRIRSESRIQIVLHGAASGRRAGSYLQKTEKSPGHTNTLAPWHHCLAFAFREPTSGLEQISLGLGKESKD